MTPTPTAAEILARTAERYATCRTYQDTGESRTTYINGPKPWEKRTDRKPFRTFFKRPTSLFLEYREMTVGPESEWARAFVCANDSNVNEWSTRPLRLERQQPLKLHDALASLIGVSGGSAGITPWLLLPQSTHYPLPDPSTTELVGEEHLDGHACFRLRGPARIRASIDIWIDSNELLIRQTSRTTVFDAAQHAALTEEARKHLESIKQDDPKRAQMEKHVADLATRKTRDFTTESVTTLAGSFDRNIDPAVFEFRPPAGNR